MEEEFNREKYQEGKDNLIKIYEFKLQYPNLYNCLKFDGNIVKYIDSENIEHLIGIILEDNISLFMDENHKTLENYDEDSLELFKTKSIINMIIGGK